MSAARHLMILASAGSGKTYALTGRYIRLLAEGAPPERIVALTFTRKAAGEFFDEILKKLALASADPVQARILAREVGQPALGTEDFLRLMRAVIDAMPRLGLGTLDGFFGRIARAFPLELGISGDLEVLDDHAMQLERRRVLGRMFARAGELAEAQRDFIEAFKRATFGREEKRLGAQLDAFLDEHQEVFLAAPEGDRWGAAHRIWPDGNEWLDGAKRRPVEAAGQLRRWVDAQVTHDKARRRWGEFISAWDQWQPGAVLAEPLAYVLKKALADWAALARGAATLEFDRRAQDLDVEGAAALVAMVRFVVGGELRRRLEVTQGIHAVLQAFERHYHETVRRAGRVTFADIQRLLSPASGAPGLSQTGGDGRLAIDYRLDGAIDHWLLDEFQDTSFGQWSVLRNLIDEAVQDPEGRRSFFCVGDVKQAIYTWREGDPRLFREIFRHYTEAAPGAIATEHLDQSFRSGPAVIEMVNRTMGAAAALAALFPGRMSADWNREWRPHISAVPERNGQAAWLLADDEAGRWRTTLDLLQEIAPLRRGLSCAVLVQTNRVAAELAEYLRHEGGLAAVAECDLPVGGDNPVGSALLALLHVIAHPGDQFAWQHMQMTPFRDVLAARGIRDAGALAEDGLAAIHRFGFEQMVATWLDAVSVHFAVDDEFSRLRVRHLVDAARQFDASGRRDIAEFREFMEHYTLREPEGASVVRIMTIHKAKGLGFDVVVLPDLEGVRLDEARGGLAVHKGPTREVEWILDPPSKILAQGDTVLDAHFREAEAEGGYEALSVLYVALTRAKSGLYVVTKPPGESTSRNYPRLLAEALAGSEATTARVNVGSKEFASAWSTGDAAWFVGLAFPSEKPADARIPRCDSHHPRSGRFESLRASAHPERRPPATLFTQPGWQAREFGTTVHRLLAEVEWNADGPWEAQWLSRKELPQAVAEAVAVLQAAELQELWRRPSAGELWRERAFELIWDEAWITGTIDRAVIVADPRTGVPQHATVYDFKTERTGGADGEELGVRHASQMRHYRQAVARLTGLPLEQVVARIVSTRLRRLVPVD